MSIIFLYGNNNNNNNIEQEKHTEFLLSHLEASSVLNKHKTTQRQFPTTIKDFTVYFKHSYYMIATKKLVKA